jgi:glucokinase
MPPSIIITEKHAVPAASSLTAAPNRIFGLDIGGTKCALSVLRDGRVEEIVRVETGDFTTTFNLLTDALGAYVADTSPIFGISCGGPLDASAGIVLSPPNLHASWHGVAITRLLTQRFGGRAFLMNDANACALAMASGVLVMKWRFRNNGPRAARS